jgi:hypothetical protein
MSNTVLNSVFERSKSKGIARLVLLCLADRANDDGRAWCGATDIATRANIKRYNVTRVVEQLCRLGELAVEYRKGPKCCNIYQIAGSLTLRQSHPETVSPRVGGVLKVSKKCSHGETQTPITPINPLDSSNGSKNRPSRPLALGFSLLMKTIFPS